MRRKDREVTDFPEILEIIEHCDILRLGLADGGAMAGRKYEVLRRNPVCSFEMDNPLYIECLPEKKDVTMRYECVMGRADVTFLGGEERQRAIDDVLMARYEMTKDFAYNQAVVSHTALMKLTVTELTAKANRA